jgi:hypothetical protein
MFANILSWFSKEATPNSTSDATTSIESHQLTSPEAPSINRMVTEQPVRYPRHNPLTNPY